MKFLLDANLPAQLAREFQVAGHECVHMETLLPRYASDMTIAKVANKTGAIVVSRDSDFAQFAQDGTLSAPFLWVRLGNLRRAAIAATIRARLPTIVASFEAGETLVVLR